MSAGFDDVDIERLRRRRTVKWALYGPDVLAAWVAEMDFDVAPPVRTALLEAIDREDFGYVVPDLGELTSACADFFAAEYGWVVPETRIFAVADVLTGISAAIDLFVAPGSGVVIPTPAYPPFFEIVELTNRPVVATPMIAGSDRATLDLDAIDTALGSGASAVLLCSPHNPTGRVFTAPELSGLAAVVDRHGARVVADEVHAPLVYDGFAHVPYATVSDAAAEHSVTVTSASKAFNLAGLKCAQVVATNHADAARCRTLRVFEVAGQTPLGIAATTAAYREGRSWLRELVGYLAANRDFIIELLAAEVPGITCRRPEATFLAWLDCSALGVDDPARLFLDHARVALSDGPPFGPGCGQHVRLNFATSRALLEQIALAMGAAARAHARAGVRTDPVGRARRPYVCDALAVENQQGGRGRWAIAIGTAFVLVAAASAPAAANGGSTRTRRLERAVAQIARRPDGPPGIAVVVQDGRGRPRFFTAGVADRGTGAPIRSTDHLRLASVAKAFSGAVALAVVAEGDLDLDDTIGEVLPALPTGWHNVKLRQLLNHTSRIPDFSADPAFLDALVASLDVAPPPAELLSFVEDDDPALIPGRGYRYSNSDNIIVALMATAATGVPYEELLETHVYRRLGLSRTSLPAGPELPLPFVHGYDVAQPEDPEDVSELFAAGWTYSSGGVVSTPADANRFARGYAAGHTTNRVTRQAQRVFIPNGSSEPPGPGRNSAGLAIFRYQTRCGTVYGHTGNTPGYTNFVAATPDGHRSATVHISSQLTPERNEVRFAELRNIFELAVCAALA